MQESPLPMRDCSLSPGALAEQRSRARTLLASSDPAREANLAAIAGFFEDGS
jgi:hypothetical protein